MTAVILHKETSKQSFAPYEFAQNNIDFNTLGFLSLTVALHWGALWSNFLLIKSAMQSAVAKLFNCFMQES